MDKSPTSRLLRALLLALALLAAACGSDNTGGNESAPATSPTAESVQTAPPPTEAPPSAEPSPESTPEPTEEPEPTSEPEPTPEPTAEPEPTSEPEPTPEPTAEPEPGSHPSGLDIVAIEEAVAGWMDDAAVPGVVLAVALGDEDPWTFGWGVRDLDTGDPVTPDDYFRIGSITKSVTAATVLSLVDEGVLDLDAPVTSYLGDDWYGDYEYGPDITLRHLLGHTAGFVEYAFDPGFFVLGSARLNVPISPEEIVRFSTIYRPVAEFTTQYNYSTAGFVIAGMVIEAVTGNAAHDEIRSRFLEPLGLMHTYLPPGEFPPEAVVGNYNAGLLATAFSSLTSVPDGARHNFKGNDYIATMSYPQEFLQSAGWTGGGMEARIGDVAQLYRGLFAGGILSDESLAELTTPGVNPGYGLGVGIDVVADHDVLSHGGGVPGFRSKVLYFPELDLSLAASSNVLPPDPDIDDLMEVLAQVAIASWEL